MSIRVINRGEIEGGSLRGERDGRRIKGSTFVECFKGMVIENKKMLSDFSQTS